MGLARARRPARPGAALCRARRCVDRWAGTPIYLASTAAVLIAVLRNLGIPEIPIVALGAASNLLAILVNGGVMPASPEAVAALEPEAAGLPTARSCPTRWLRPLTDIFTLPPWVPFANVFSIGDVLIGLGVVVVIALGMRQRATQTG